jgi:hypothetical protein
MCISASNRQRIEKVQKKAIRIITNSAYNANTKPFYHLINLLPSRNYILCTPSNINTRHLPLKIPGKKIVTLTLQLIFVTPMIFTSPNLGLKPSKKLRIMP